MNYEEPQKGGMDAPGADLPTDNEPVIDDQEFCIKICVYRDHTYEVTKEPLDIDANARNGGYEAEMGKHVIDNMDDALRAAYRMMKDAVMTEENQQFQDGFGEGKKEVA